MKSIKNMIGYMLVSMVGLFLIPHIVFAEDTLDEEDDFIKVAEVTKYYKTITYYNNADYATASDDEELLSETIEITKEEYDAFDPTVTTASSTTVETTYKELTTSISANSSKYRYRVELNWKNMPSKRSYDIIGLGHYANVKNSGNTTFVEQYCESDGTCACGSTFTKNVNNTGTSVVFKLPTAKSLAALNATLLFDVEKNTTATILKQLATGDYAHATKTVTKSKALNHTINSQGLTLSNSITDSYDTISAATTVWTGSW